MDELGDDEEAGAVGGGGGQDAEGVALRGAEATAEFLGGHGKVAGRDGAGRVFLPEIADSGLVEGQDLDDAAYFTRETVNDCVPDIVVGGGGYLPKAEADGREFECSAFEQGGGWLVKEAGDFRWGGKVCGDLHFLA